MDEAERAEGRDGGVGTAPRGAGLRRRTVLRGAALAVGTGAALYVKPSLTELGVVGAQAAVSFPPTAELLAAGTGGGAAFRGVSAPFGLVAPPAAEAAGEAGGQAAGKSAKKQAKKKAKGADKAAKQQAKADRQEAREQDKASKEQAKAARLAAKRTGKPADRDDLGESGGARV
jgi:hypothetical protein